MCVKKFLCLSRSLTLFLPHHIPTPSDRQGQTSRVLNCRTQGTNSQQLSLPRKRGMSSPIPPGSQRAAALASIRHSPTQHLEKAHAWGKKPCHLCLLLRCRYSFQKDWSKQLQPTSFGFSENSYFWPAAPTSQSEFHTCVSCFSCFEEVITNNCFHML